jgi:hypothetical protein
MSRGWQGRVGRWWLAAAAAALIPLAAPSAPAAATGTIAGTVRFAGDAPAMEVQRNTKDTAKCGTEIKAEGVMSGIRASTRRSPASASG